LVTPARTVNMMERAVGTDAERESAGASTQVAFIAGASWSGSTLLEQELAQLDGCVSLGESFWIWDPHWLEMTCECGVTFRRCEFWQAVMEEAYGGARETVRAEVRARSQGLWRHSVLPALVRSRSPFPRAALGDLGEMVAPVYAAAKRITGASHVVDASKAGLWGMAVSLVPSIDLHVVHLVRDPTAYLASDGRPRDVPYPPGATRPPRAPSRSLLTWLLLHFEADVLAMRSWDSTLVLYDDLVRAPAQTAERVALAIGLAADVATIFDGRALVVRQPGHAIGGNPRRPGRGQTSIERQRRSDPVVSLAVRRALLPLAEARYRRYVSVDRDRRDALSLVGVPGSAA
jgi:hypothetical protein